MGYSAYFSWYKNGGNYHPTGFHLRLFLFELLLWPVIVKNYSSVGRFLEGPIISRVFHLCSPFLQIYVERVLKEMKMLQKCNVELSINEKKIYCHSNENRIQILIVIKNSNMCEFFYFFQLIFFSLLHDKYFKTVFIFVIYILYDYSTQKINK